jgi:hypothetical protein
VNLLRRRASVLNDDHYPAAPAAAPVLEFWEEWSLP